MVRAGFPKWPFLATAIRRFCEIQFSSCPESFLGNKNAQTKSVHRQPEWSKYWISNQYPVRDFDIHSCNEYLVDPVNLQWLSGSSENTSSPPDSWLLVLFDTHSYQMISNFYLCWIVIDIQLYWYQTKVASHNHFFLSKPNGAESLEEEEVQFSLRK